MKIQIKIILLMIMTVVLFYCKEKSFIYEPTPESIHYGSLLYASSELNCKNCHGIDYKGNGPDAKDLEEKVPDFTGEIPPEKTPLDYFKVISVGTKNTGNEYFNYHAFYSLTDKAKWALANYLYSLSKQPSDPEAKKIRKEALAKSQKEVQSIYAQNRKWYMGKNTPSSQRESAPNLDELIQNTNFNVAQDVSVVNLTEEQIQKIMQARKQYQEGYEIYKNNCQSCHGIGVEGVQGSRLLGVLDQSRKEPVKNIARRKPSFWGVPALLDRKWNVEMIQNIHGEYHFSQHQWNDLIQYINAITEK